MATAPKRKEKQLELLEASEIAPRPFIKWAGGKSSLLPLLLSRCPNSFGRYVEPMIGGGALFFRLQAMSKKPRRATIADINPELVNLYTVVKNKPEELIVDLARHSYEEEYFFKLRDVDRSQHYAYWSDIQRASRFIYLNRTCFNGLYRVNSKGQFNVPFGRYTNPRILDPEGIRASSRALENTKIVQGSFEGLSSQFREGDFAYFDPPYMPLSKTSSFTSYVKEGFGFAMQEKLRDFVLGLSKKGVQWMLSNSDTPAIWELYDGCGLRIEKIEARRNINSNGKKRGSVGELIIRNYS